MSIRPFGIRRLILASASPRRRQLLPLLGLPFLVKATSVDERPLDSEPPSELVIRVSRAKASAVDDVRPDEVVIAADTVVVLDGQVLGKPHGPAEASYMLRQLRGRCHKVYSGASVWHADSRRMVHELSESTVWMRNYSDDEIARYVESGDPFDKAGAYAIQNPVFDPVAHLEGCWLTVMGFPLCHVARALRTFGVVVPSNVPGACQAFNQRDCAVSPELLRAVP